MLNPAYFSTFVKFRNTDWLKAELSREDYNNLKKYANKVFLLKSCTKVDDDLSLAVLYEILPNSTNIDKCSTIQVSAKLLDPLRSLDIVLPASFSFYDGVLSFKEGNLDCRDCFLNRLGTGRNCYSGCSTVSAIYTIEEKVEKIFKINEDDDPLDFLLD